MVLPTPLILPSELTGVSVAAVPDSPSNDRSRFPVSGLVSVKGDLVYENPATRSPAKEAPEHSTGSKT